MKWCWLLLGLLAFRAPSDTELRTALADPARERAAWCELAWRGRAASAWSPELVQRVHRAGAPPELLLTLGEIGAGQATCLGLLQRIAADVEASAASRAAALWALHRADDAAAVTIGRTLIEHGDPLLRQIARSVLHARGERTD